VAEEEEIATESGGKFIAAEEWPGGESGRARSTEAKRERESQSESTEKRRERGGKGREPFTSLFSLFGKKALVRWGEWPH